MTLKKLKNLKDVYEKLESEEKVILYFYTTFCPDCIVLKPHLSRLESDFKEYTFYSLHRDKFIDLARHLEIYGIPSFLIFENGEEKGRLVNKLRKSYIEIKTFIENTITN